VPIFDGYGPRNAKLAKTAEFRRLFDQLKYTILIPMLCARVEQRFHPQGAPNDALECGGWRCDCSLEVTKEKPTDKQPGDVQAAG
jgi:hypothetical protein